MWLPFSWKVTLGGIMVKRPPLAKHKAVFSHRRHVSPFRQASASFLCIRRYGGDSGKNGSSSSCSRAGKPHSASRRGHRASVPKRSLRRWERKKHCCSFWRGWMTGGSQSEGGEAGTIYLTKESQVPFPPSQPELRRTQKGRAVYSSEGVFISV